MNQELDKVGRDDGAQCLGVEPSRLRSLKRRGVDDGSDSLYDSAHMPKAQQTRVLRFSIEARTAVERLPFSAPAFLTCAAAGDMKPQEPLHAPGAGGEIPAGETPQGDPRGQVFAAAGAAGKRLLSVKQEHTREVLTAEEVAAYALEHGAGSRPEADGIVGDDPELLLAVTVADCMPIYLHDRRRGAVGMLHSGWKGTGILLGALELMCRRWGSTPSEVSVLLGPAIQACCYEVDAERARGFQTEFGEESAVQRAGAWYLDLQTANRALAERAGVAEISVCTNCTCCGEGLFSYRREGPEGYRRMLAAVQAPSGNTDE